MPIERTLSMIKPDATRRDITGKIIAKLEEAGLSIIAQKRLHLTDDQARQFYAVHREKSFFDEMIEQITSGPVVVQVLQGENAISRNREAMGVTNPDDAADGTIRGEFGLSIGENSVHGSDSPENAMTETAFFFSTIELVG